MENDVYRNPATVVCFLLANFFRYQKTGGF